VFISFFKNKYNISLFPIYWNIPIINQDLAKSLADGNQIDIILLDFSKAFDKVPHQRLIHRLNYYGIRDKHLNWITDFI
jgi:hypothetical protein